MGNACCDNREGQTTLIDQSLTGGEAGDVNLVNTATLDSDSTLRNGNDRRLSTSGGSGRMSGTAIGKRLSLSGKDDSKEEDKEFAREKEVNVACLAWMISTHTHSVATNEQLQELHLHLATCVDLVDAEVIVSEVAFGVVRRRRGGGDAEMSDADAMLRFGQLLCRWGASHNVGLRVGAHVGTLERIQVPDLVNRRRNKGEAAATKASCFGSACALAIHLATSSENECMVHISSQAKDKLDAYRLVRLTISKTQSSYYLDPTTVMRNFFKEGSMIGDSILPSEVGTSSPQQNQSMLLDVSSAAEPVEGVKKMTFEEFNKFLESHNVDVGKFGKGVAKSMEEFYDAVVIESKSHLKYKDGVLWRFVDLVRISLRIRDKDNRLRELRIASQSTKDGGTRTRDQPLAFVLKSQESDQWKEAVERLFEEKLQLAISVQRDCFVYDMDTYSVTEDESTSETIPGIPTLYKAHNIVINIKDKSKKELKNVGLPTGMAFTMGAGAKKKSWVWGICGDSQEESLMTLLQKHGVDPADFAPQAFADLYEEVYEKKQSFLEVQNNILLRKISIIKVWLHAQVLNVDHVLLIKAKWQKGQFDSVNKDQPISMRMSHGQDWEVAVAKALLTRLSLPEDFQRQFISVDTASHQITEEVGYSRSYPGLKTLYVVNEVTCHVMDSCAAGAHLIGLPAGTDFAFSRKTEGKPYAEDVVVTHWCWQHIQGYEEQRRISMRRSVSARPALNDSADTTCTADQLFRRRVPKPKPVKLMKKCHGTAAQLAGLMKGRKTDWDKAWNAAKLIRDPDYSCKEYHDDIVAAFPELRLYYLIPEGEEEEELASSGRTADDEYQRTVGALFAVYWLMRIDIDGKEAFSFGLDDLWMPRAQTDPVWNKESRDPEELLKRRAFFDGMNWRATEQLLIDGGLLKYDKDDNIIHDIERTLTMLVMMALHDIMKMAALLPKVDKNVKEFRGYKSTETISDHDTALAYIMLHHAQMLPSFAGLTKAQQNMLKFVHCKMEYNMGWLVQAEAPPGALFSKFRDAIQSGETQDSDVAFYFIHWFVDLAAAEPCPLEGCEKFVLKFPLRVLTRFLDSFNVVQTLAHQTETQVLEEYLQQSWKAHEPVLTGLPTGPGSVARMRLVLMAQDKSMDVLNHFGKISPEDQQVLCFEMACTGVQGQQFDVDDLVGAPTRGKGPAILIYYSPALLQKNGAKDPRGALMILAEVFRQTRALWPLQMSLVNESVIVRIDVLKELECEMVIRPQGGAFYVVSKTSSKDAVVKVVGAAELQSMDWNSNKILTFKKRSRHNLTTAVDSVVMTVKRFSSFLGT